MEATAVSSSDRASLVLIVDDDRSMRMLLALAMEEEGYQLIEAQDGEQCLEEFQRCRPHIVLLDAVMPGMDGMECCRRLRALPGGDRVPILIVTVLDDRDSVDCAFAAGATDYVTKPIYWPVLCQRVHRLLEANRSLERAWLAGCQLDGLQRWAMVVQELGGAIATSNAKGGATVDRIRGILDRALGCFGFDGIGWLHGPTAGAPEMVWCGAAAPDRDRAWAAVVAWQTQRGGQWTALVGEHPACPSDPAALGAAPAPDADAQDRAPWHVFQGDQLAIAVLGSANLGGLVGRVDAGVVWTDALGDRWQTFAQLFGATVAG